MKYAIIDFEYNQPFNFEKNENGKVVGNCPFEIIQIGAVKVDGENIENFNAYIKPEIYERLNPFVKKITDISKETLKNEDSFKNVYKSFHKFIDEPEIVLCFWGNNDIRELFKNLKYHNIDYSLLNPMFINIQTLACEYLEVPTGKTIGLKNACEALNINMDLNFHNALNDAIYTAEVFKIVKQKKMRKEVFNIKTLSKKAVSKNYKVNHPLLYKEAERDFGRLLTKKEKKIIRKFYELGRLKSFDNKNL